MGSHMTKETRIGRLADLRRRLEEAMAIAEGANEPLLAQTISMALDEATEQLRILTEDQADNDRRS
jgi:hypothetical protein